MPTPHSATDVIDVRRDTAALFGLLDELGRGLAREAALALTPEERAARAESIIAWFVPRSAAAPCPLPWTIHLGDPASDSPDPEAAPP
jgi:hypothetical protein